MRALAEKVLTKRADGRAVFSSIAAPDDDESDDELEASLLAEARVAAGDNPEVLAILDALAVSEDLSGVGSAAGGSRVANSSRHRSKAGSDRHHQSSAASSAFEAHEDASYVASITIEHGLDKRVKVTDDKAYECDETVTRIMSIVCFYCLYSDS